MSQQVLKDSFFDVLSSIKSTEVEEVLESQDMVDVMFNKLNNEPTIHPTSFTDYLQDECGVPPRQILSIIEGIVSRPEMVESMGIKLSSIWLLFKLFKELGIHTNKPQGNKIKRKTVKNAFVAYSFPGSNLTSLLQACIPAAGQEMGEQEIKDWIDNIGTKPGVDLQQLFYKEEHIADKSAQEELNDLIKDYRDFPQGSLQKELQRQIILAHIQKNQSGKNQIVDFLPQSKQETDIDALRNKFKEQSISLHKEIEDLLNKAKTAEAYEALSALKSKIFGINVLELSRLIEKTNEAKKLIKDKDVIFMIGNTGSGKSTNILRFLGYELKLRKVNDLDTLLPTKELQKDHKTFFTSPLPKSCTRFINAVKVPAEMYEKNTAQKKMTLVMCDSPGFGDSAGVQVDIANGVGMINALHGARSVRVVVILPSDSLTGDRMAGAVKMGQIISNLFYELTILKSVVIYFNKVPNGLISTMPKMIQEKIKFLTPAEKANEKLMTFFKEMHIRSQDKENFIDPINGDYKKLFQKICTIDPITKVMQSFQYEFTSQTKQKISKFVQGERGKVRELFMARKYSMSQFHLKTIRIMMNTLHNDDKIKVCYNELLKFVQAESEKQLSFYEQIINQVMSARGSPNLKPKLEDSRNRILQIEELFQDFEGLHVAYDSKIKEIIKGRKDRLLDQFINLDEVTTETIIAAKSFSALVDKTLEQKVIALIERRFKDIYQDTDRQIKSNDYNEMGKNLKYLSNLASYIAQLIQPTDINKLANKLTHLKTNIEEEAELALTWIALNINSPDARIVEKNVRQANQKIELVKKIEGLNFLDKNNQIKTKLTKELKIVEVKCKNIIRDLETLRLTLVDDTEGKVSIEKEELKNKKKQIEMLMKIENLQENLADDYKYAKESLGRKLRENEEILKNCIIALKSDKSDEINRNLDNIKKAINIVLQCSQIVDQGDAMEIAESIGKQFVSYLGGVRNGLQTIEFKLTQINDDTLRKIKQQHKKIQSYEKMGSISEKVQQAITKLNNELIDKLKAPFIEYNIREVPYLKEKGHYRFITYSIDKLEKFSTYALGVYDIVSAHQYGKISQCEEDIKKGLEPLYKQMEKDIEDFINLKFAHSIMPPYLKDLVKNLLTISQKNKACEYLTQKLNFQVSEKLKNIENKLNDFISELNSAYQKQQTNAQELQALLADCKQFGEIEDIYKSKGEPQNKFGFRELQRKCNEESMKSLKSDEDRCKVIIEGNKPTNILFSELQTYYENFVNIKTAEGERKRKVIVYELKKVEQATISVLDKIRKNIANLGFDSLSDKIDDILEALNQAVELERNLKKLYSHEQDKGLITIKQADIHKIGLKIIGVFEGQFEIVTELLKTFNLANIKEKLKTFGQLENMIYDVFNFDDGEFQLNEQKIEKKQSQSEMRPMEENKISKYETGGQYNVKGEERLANFINSNVATLQGIIQSHPFIKEGKISAKSTKRLKNLLEILKRGVEIEIKTKYENDGPAFNIDDNFQIFYSHCNEDKRHQLDVNVERYLDDQYSQYKEIYNREKDPAENLQKHIEQKIGYLPTKLRPTHTKAFNLIKATLIKENDELINNTSRSILQNPTSIANFFQLSNRSRINGQKDLHRKWVQSFTDIYSQVQQKETPLNQNIIFIEKSFIEVYMRQKEYFTNDVLMFEQFKKKYVMWISNITRGGKEAIKQIYEMVSLTGGNEQKKNKNYKPIVNNIFLVFNFVLRLKDDGIMDHTEFRRKFLVQYQQKLNEVVECYKDTLKTQPKQNLNSKQILEMQNMRKLQNYVENITFVGAIKDQISQLLDRYNSNMIITIIGHNFLSSIHIVQRYTQKLEQYEKTITQMHKFIMDFEFCTDVKRNFAPKQVEQDLGQLDRYFEILQQGQQLFTNSIIRKTNNKYSIAKISTVLLSKFEGYYKQAKSEIEETFKAIDGEPATKINLFIRQLSIMRVRDRDLKFISAEKVKQRSDEISLYLKQKFQSQKEACAKSLQAAKAKFAQVNRDIQLLETKRKQDVENQKGKYKAILDTRLTELQKKCDEKISLQSDENKKQDYKKDLANEQNSAKNEIEEERDKKIKVIDEHCEVKKKTLNESLKVQVQAFTQAITIYQKAVQDICEEAPKYKKNLDTVLDNMTKNEKGEKVSPKFLKQIQDSLAGNPDDRRSIGTAILDSNKAFANYNVEKRKRQTAAQDIHFVLKNLQKITLTGRDKVPDYEMKNVLDLYMAFKTKYEELKEKYRSNPSQTTINYMITPIKDLGTQIKQEFYQARSPLKQAENKVELLAGIFALWAILKSESFQGDVQFIVEPHPTQISTLILLLGISHPNENQNNRLAQVGTGEGKSIVLAGLSSYLALVGFKVRCACYSAYLSGRDQESFKILFERLGIENNIKYGTFNELCEDILNGNGGNLKDQVQKKLLQPPQGIVQRFTNFLGVNTTSLNRGPNEIMQNPTILVIDEVDVFFEDSFFGNSYCPGISLRSPAVSNFLEVVWREALSKGKDIDPAALILSTQFKQLVGRYPSLEDLLKNQVHGMVAGALNYKHDYFIIEKRIAYKDNDTISYKINYGYKTVFAYLYEHQHKRVTKAYLDEALQITLMIAEFSYAALPNYFCNILGVTGTLEVLPHYKKKQLSERYRINDQYAIPSAFGLNGKRISNYFLTPTINYNKKIVEMINKVNDDRPIIIFFKGPRELNEFFNCAEYQPFLKRTFNLTEEHNASARDSRIINAVEPKKITLMSSAYGRGTDFVIRNDNIKEKGGLHVIHAFLSLQESEEVQIKGRTARQNGQGSYDCVIDEGWLQQINLNLASFPKDSSSDDIHSVMLRARQNRIEKLSQSTMKMLEEADKKHDNVVKIFSAEKLAQTDLITYVSTLNKYPQIRKVTIKTVLGLDATGSMSAALRKCCEIIGGSFERTYKVLNQKEVKATIEVKIMVYRNYNSPAEQIIQGTTFENTPANLKQFLDRVGPSGGWGNEAVQVLFQSMNKEQKIDQVILIGDAAPNQPTEVTSKRSSRGEQYWVSKGFPLATFEKELDTFKKNKKCPVHCFYLAAKHAFEDISRQNGGKCSPFDVNSPRAANDLTDFVVMNILELIEKNSGQGQGSLVEVYRRMFC